MAEYRALAQNTYKFVTEHILQYAGDIGTPNAPQSSRVKAVVNGQLMYLPLFPVDTDTSTNTPGVTYSSGNASITWTGTNNWRTYGDAQTLSASVIIDGIKYYGTRNAKYVCFSRVTDVADSSSDTFSLTETISFPKGILKIVKYSSLEGTIVAEKMNFAGGTINPASCTGKSNSYYIAFQEAKFWIAKTTNDIILAISVEYPKYNITLSGTGLQYSIDDGVTFQDVTDGLVLEQVEHIILKNTDTVTHNIGTTEGGTDFANIPAGDTFLAVPTADGTLYIS